MTWSETDLAYLAGFIDGEGSICIFPSIRNGRRRDNLRFDVYNTNKDILLWIQQVFGGKVHLVKSRSRLGSDRWKPEYTWQAGSLHAVMVLTACLPYLKLKRRQADLFIQHQATSRRNGRNRTPPGVLLVRAAIIDEMRTLNRRGPL